MVDPDAMLQTSDAIPKVQAAKVKPVTHERKRSPGFQPSSHSNANTANTTPGASTTKIRMACERLTSRYLLPAFEAVESKPSEDVEACRRTIHATRALRAGAPTPHGTPHIRCLSARGRVPRPDRSSRVESNDSRRVASAKRSH